MNSDEYLTIKNITLGEYKEKGSKFLAYCFPFDHENKLQAILEEVKSKNLKARHYCFAYKIGINNNRFRTNDDGEPSGTAGKPIFGQILSHNLTNILVVVVRYFGGIKLGASGLTNAYKESTHNGLSNATVISEIITKRFQLNFGYKHMGQILATLKEHGIEIISKKFEEDCNVITEIRLSLVNDKISTLKADLIGVSTDVIDVNTKIDFCSITEVIN